MSEAGRESSPAGLATVFTHQDPPETGDAIERIAALASGHGWRLVATEGELGSAGPGPKGVEIVEELPRSADLSLDLGGDGSILRALRHHAGSGTRVFGVNFGTVGFLASVDRDGAEDGILRAFAGDLETVELPALELEAGGDAHLAFNDVTFARRPHGRVAELAYRITGEEVGHVSCDGIVVATPTGSTGYNLANHGPILAWGVEGYVVSYIAPHTLTARALVVAPRDVLTVENSAELGSVDLVIDGHPVGELAGSKRAHVRFRNGAGRLAQLPGTSFYHRIREKFGHLAV